MEPLRPGRHDLPRELVRESQRRRLMTAAAEVLAAEGYAGITVTGVTRQARVSSSTFYKRFDDLWACLLEVYEADAASLCEAVENAPSGSGEEASGPIGAGLALLAADPALTCLLSTEPPARAPELRQARGRLIERLAGSLRASHPGEREKRQVSAALALIASRARAEGASSLPGLAPTLSEILLRRAG